MYTVENSPSCGRSVVKTTFEPKGRAVQRPGHRQQHAIFLTGKVAGSNKGGYVDVLDGDRPVVVHVQGAVERQEDHLPVAALAAVDRQLVVEVGALQVLQRGHVGAVTEVDRDAVSRSRERERRGVECAIQAVDQEVAAAGRADFHLVRHSRQVPHLIVVSAGIEEFGHELTRFQLFDMASTAVVPQPISLLLAASSHSFSLRAGRTAFG